MDLVESTEAEMEVKRGKDCNNCEANEERSQELSPGGGQAKFSRK